MKKSLNTEEIIIIILELVKNANKLILVKIDVNLVMLNIFKKNSLTELVVMKR